MRVRQRPQIGLIVGLLMLICGTTASAAVRVSPPGEAVVGSALDLNRYRGSVVYLDFWASWCAPCKLSFPFMNNLRGQFRPKDLVILTVNMDSNKDAASAFLRSVGGDLPVIFDPTGSLASRFDVSAMPTSVLIGRDGRVRYVHRG